MAHHNVRPPPPPRSRMTRATPPLPDLTPHVQSDDYAFVISNLNKHKSHVMRQNYANLRSQYRQNMQA
jgi:predicted mannosyl-3-phosphoglycerate phosphatase (HAD superfamily)